MVDRIASKMQERARRGQGWECTSNKPSMRTRRSSCVSKLSDSSASSLYPGQGQTRSNWPGKQAGIGAGQVRVERMCGDSDRVLNPFLVGADESATASAPHIASQEHHGRVPASTDCRGRPAPWIAEHLTS